MRCFFLDLLLFTLLTASSISCRSGLRPETGRGLALDSFSRDIPRYANGDTSVDYLFKRKVEGLLNLEPIELGVDSLEIRVWYSYALIDTAQLIVIKKKRMQDWECFLYTFSYRFQPEHNSVKSLEFQGYNAIPKSGWVNVIDALKSYDIFGLPDESSLRNYAHSTDEVGVTVEVSDTNHYRIYGYASPSAHREEFEAARRMSDIILLLEHEFNFPPLEEL